MAVSAIIITNVPLVIFDLPSFLSMTRTHEVKIATSYLSVLHVVTAVVLLLTTARVFYLMRDNSFLQREKMIIGVMAVTFCIAYIFRAFCSAIVYQKIYSSQITYSLAYYYMWTIVPGILTDCVPIAAVCWVHHLNFGHVDPKSVTRSLRYTRITDSLACFTENNTSGDNTQDELSEVLLCELKDSYRSIKQDL